MKIWWSIGIFHNTPSWHILTNCRQKVEDKWYSKWPSINYVVSIFWICGPSLHHVTFPINLHPDIKLSGQPDTFLGLHQQYILSGCRPYFFWSMPLKIAINKRRGQAASSLLGYWTLVTLPLTQSNFFQVPTVKKIGSLGPRIFLGLVTDPTFQSKNQGHRLRR